MISKKSKKGKAISVDQYVLVSKDAILYAGTFKFSKKSTAVLSKGDEKHIRPSSSATLNNFPCHSQGV